MHRFVRLLLSVVSTTLPLAAFGEPKSLALETMNVTYDQKIVMRDGVQLSADIVRPGDNGRYPTILQLTPYDDGNYVLEDAQRLVERGYAFVSVDVRGRYDSEGEFDPYRTDGPDGFDVINWIVRQPWSNTKVATFGYSYAGKNQWLIAREGNRAHAAIVSYVATANEFTDGVRFNGVPRLDLYFTWAMSVDGRVDQSLAGVPWPKVMRELPLHTLDAAAGREVEFWSDWMRHSHLDDWWKPIDVSGFYKRINIPSFNVTGWYDGQLRGAVRHYTEVRRASRRPSQHNLVIGPWLHTVNKTKIIGERDSGVEGLIDLQKLEAEWLDHHMLRTSRPTFPNFVYFLPVRNEWRGASAFPIPGTRSTKYLLESGGRANTRDGDGVLQGKIAGGPPDSFVYDPSDPVPTVSSRTAVSRGLPQGPIDNKAVEGRQDVLVYTGPVLSAPLEITGPVTATIYMSTDVPDTDITVKLLDVYPDGRVINLTEGIARAQYRESFTLPSMLTPDKVYKIDVELFPVSNWYEPGHRVRIEVSSSDFPNFARNLNTGNSDTSSEKRIAHTKIYHNRQYPSAIVLPVIPSGTTKRWKPPLVPVRTQ